MTRRSINRLFVFSFYMLLLLALGVAVLAYLISPLRDPNFVPLGSNAGATIDWLRPEKYWMVLINAFTISLATNVTILMWLWFRSKDGRWLTVGRDFFGLLLKVLSLVGLWIAIAYIIWLVSLTFLLDQWIID